MSDMQAEKVVQEIADQLSEMIVRDTLQAYSAGKGLEESAREAALYMKEVASHAYTSLMTKLQAENERLTRGLAHWQQRAEQWEADNSIIRARISELEKALERIAASDINNFDTLHPSACASVARDILKGGEKKGKTDD